MKGLLVGLKSRTLDTLVNEDKEGSPKPMTVDQLLQRFCYNAEKPAAEQVENLYMCWLYGVTSRQLGKVLGCDKNKVVQLFEQHYGEDAANCGAKSLLQSLAHDYPTCPITEKFIRDNIALKEPNHGTEVTVYTSKYRGKVVTKVREQRVYTRHRSKHKMQQLTRAQCRDDLWQTLSEYVGVEDTGYVESGESQEPII